MRLLLTAALLSTVAFVATAMLGVPHEDGADGEFSVVAVGPDPVGQGSGGTQAEHTGSVAGATRAAGGASPVTANVVQRNYRVRGTSAGELLQSLRTEGPHLDGGVFFGLTVAESEYRFRYRPGAGRCETVDARVSVQISVTLPAWSPPVEAPAALRTQWSQFERSLQVHENGHRDLAVAGAHRLHNAVQGVRAPTCDEAAGRAAQLAERVQIETEARHRQYDADTEHGATQGATWPY